MKPSPNSIEALYIHIPFCRKICPFCAFAVRKERASLHKNYLQAVCTELRLHTEQVERTLLGNIQSIFIGGGTPSSLALSEVEFLLNTLQQQMKWANDIEISFELNPEDATPEYIEGLLALGIRRLSLGVQSFQQESLQTLQRNHSAAQSIRAVENLCATATNFNLDVMFGIPGQSFQAFQNDLQIFLQNKPPHLSLYALEIEPNTPFAHQSKWVRWLAHNQSLIQKMYLWAIEAMHLQDIFQYEVSNFAQPLQKSRSNLLVWSGKPYLGLGVGAHSHHQGRRWGNVRSLRSYQKALSQGVLPRAFEETLSPTEQANESLMLGLRQTSGFSTRMWPEQFSRPWPQKNNDLLEIWQAQGLLMWNPPWVSLRPKGMLLADEITQKLMLG